ncbi:MAG TPA: DUF721 domain-containing protein [Candidatus Didemnitutus sp.]|jgi:hypothetical protein
MSEPPKEFSREVQNLIASFRSLPHDDRRSHRRPATGIAPLIEALLIKHRIGRDSIEHEIRSHWSEIVGPANAAFSHPVTVERNQLLVLVSHAVVRNELFLHRAAILKKLRAMPGCGEIRAVMLRSG